MSEPGRQDEQLTKLKERIDDLKARLPAHSIPAAMLIELEELEEALEAARAAALRGEQ